MSKRAAEGRLGAYRIVGKLGEGAMGIVHEGVHEVLGRRVAIKTLRRELTRNPQIAGRFLREARAATAVRHENIVSVYDHGHTADGVAYIVMELLEGRTLADLERASGRLPVAQLAHVFEQVLRALAEAHAAGVVHRDLKPANVFLTRRGADPLFVKLLDFGVAKLSAEWGVSGLTSTGMVLGTPVYMSPEQILGKPADARSDLFSVGVMLYQAAVGEVPFRGSTMAELGLRINTTDPAPPRARAPDLSPALEAMILTAIAKAPGARYQSATAMLHALRGATRRHDDATVIDVASRPRPPPARRRSRALLGGVIAVGVAAGVAVPVLLWPRAKAPPAGETAPPLDPRALLRDAVGSPDAAEAADAVAALALVGGARSAPLLYPALRGPPELRRQAARALQELGLPEAAPRIRDVVEASGPRLRVELAAALAALGDRDALPILRRGLDEPGARLTSALALVAAGEPDAARPVLLEIFDGTPRGRGEWQEAAAGLFALGHDPAQAALVDELSQPDGARAIAAAAVLARRGDTRGAAFLQRVAVDAGFARRGEAALALARLGDKVALAFVPTALASVDAEERRDAAAIAGRLGETGQRDALARLAAGDADRGVRFTAAAALLALGQ